jgi:hypothetical protein
MFFKGTNKNVFVWPLLFVLLSSIAVYLYTIGVARSSLNIEEHSAVADSNTSELKNIGSEESASQQTANKNVVATRDLTKVSVPQYMKTLAGTPAEAAILTKWEESRGKFSEESLADYASYDLETLVKLTNLGDIKAMTALVHFYLSPKYTGGHALDEVARVCKLAAAYGSTELLKVRAMLYAVQKYQPDSQILNHEDLIEVLAWKNTAALRGDLYPNYDARSDIKNSGIQLTQDDKGKISARSQEIYNELLAQRKSLGLGDFDNTRPPEVDKFFGFLENFMDEIK